MNKAIITVMVVLMSMCLYTCGSGGDKSQPADAEKSSKGRIEQFTDDMAQEGVDYVQKPLDKARALQKRAEQRIDAMGEDE